MFVGYRPDPAIGSQYSMRVLGSVVRHHISGLEAGFLQKLFPAPCMPTPISISGKFG